MLGYFFEGTQGGRFYVYILFRPDGRPFYVGKGVGGRINDHEKEARRGCKCRKCNTIRKIWREGGEVDRQIVLRSHDELTALKFEAQLIQRFRRQLTNIAECDPRLSARDYIRTKRPTPADQDRARQNRAAAMLAILSNDLRYARIYTPEDTEAQQRILDEMAAYRVWLRRPKQQRLELD